MRKFFVYLSVWMVLLSCSKALDVEKDMYFNQVNWLEPPGERDPIAGVAPMHLELRTDGRAFLYPGSGDIVWEGSYKVTAKKLKVTLKSIESSYEFHVTSSSELKGPNGEILRLEER